MCRQLLILGAILLPVAIASAQATAPTEESEEKEWTFSLSALTYIVPHEHDFVQPTLRVDHDWLHLEARYNYEDLGTASLWLGYNFSFEPADDVSITLTPMIGGAFGDTDGVAPGYEFNLTWRRLDLYSEAEYLIDAHDSADS